MTNKEIEAALEAVLFASGDPMSIQRLADVFEIDVSAIKENINGVRGINVNAQTIANRLVSISSQADIAFTLRMPPFGGQSYMI